MAGVVHPSLVAVGQVLLDLLVGGRCAGCGATGRRTPCGRCTDALRAAPARPDAAWVGASPARELVLAAKLGSWRGGAEWFAQQLVERCAIADVDAVTWVPADPARRARRGGCLPERCARRAARRLGVPAVPLLRRVAGTSQRGLDRVERRRNVAAAYRLSPSHLTAVAPGGRVLLVDDVRTTGATLDVVGSQLEAAGLHVRRVALLAVDSPRVDRRRCAAAGVASFGARRGIAATSADSSLTQRGLPADTLAPRPTERQHQDLTAPRPP